jgi:hypothetical protein
MEVPDINPQVNHALMLRTKILCRPFRSEATTSYANVATHFPRQMEAVRTEIFAGPGTAVHRLSRRVFISVMWPFERDPQQREMTYFESMGIA